MKDSLHKIFLDLVTARNSNDEETLQDCIDRLGVIHAGNTLVPNKPPGWMLCKVEGVRQRKSWESVGTQTIIRAAYDEIIRISNEELE